MARSIAQIQNQIINAVQSNSILSGLTSLSQVAIWRLWTYIVASFQATEESLNDSFVAQVESIVNTLPPGTTPWIQQQAFNFQYSATNPQFIQFSTASFTPFYPTVVPSYQIITNCSVQQSSPGVVIIKVAKGSSTAVPQPLATTELQALQYYFNQIKPCGINYFCSSNPADRLFSVYTITYQSGYSSTIQASLLAAYVNYLYNIPFGGTIKLIDVTLALRQVTGVIDIYCNNMVARSNSTAFGGGVIMCAGNTTILPEYTCAAGYIIDEDTSGDDFLSNLTLLGI